MQDPAGHQANREMAEYESDDSGDERDDDLRSGRGPENEPHHFPGNHQQQTGQDRHRDEQE
jgi:hypothetical protein